MVGSDTEIHAYYVGNRDPDEVRRPARRGERLDLDACRGFPPRQVAEIDIRQDRLPGPSQAAGRGNVRQFGRGGTSRRFLPSSSIRRRFDGRTAFCRSWAIRSVSSSFRSASRGGSANCRRPGKSSRSANSPALGSRERKSRIGADLLIRALAILLVVVHHETLWPIPGGSAAMVILAGFGLARFRAAHCSPAR
ncbi:hypothetical protein F2981_11775 [Sinorhizobium meliloti]|nr:hypothetical protein [Sinorhizobium meliloti]